jgi:hypothetical protein
MSRKIILMLFILVLIGCKIAQQQNPITRGEIYTGTDGLVFGFLKNAPPAQVYASTGNEKSQFNVVLELQNKGAYDIENGYLTMILEGDYMSVDNWETTNMISYAGESQARFNLEGKTMLNPLGSKEITSIKVNAKKFPEALSEKHTSSVLLAACYRYQTNLQENVCIDTDIYNLKSMDKPCQVKDLTLKSQGAPVAITKVEVEMLPHEYENKIKPIFTIYVENKGNGEVIRPDETAIESACSSSSLKIKENDLNVIYIQAYLSGKEYPLDCTPDQIKLRNKEGYIRCTLKEGKDKQYGTYESPLIIELYYGYMQTIAKEVEIKKPLAY